MNASFMRLERHERGIHAIEKPAGPGIGGRGSAQEILRHHRHRRPASTPVHDQNG
jgi:hypothetical protein